MTDLIETISGAGGIGVMLAAAYFVLRLTKQQSDVLTSMRSMLDDANSKVAALEASLSEMSRRVMILERNLVDAEFALEGALKQAEELAVKLEAECTRKH